MDPSHLARRVLQAAWPFAGGRHVQLVARPRGEAVQELAVTILGSPERHRMTRSSRQTPLRLLIALLAAVLVWCPCAAAAGGAGASQFTPAQRAEIVQIIREALKNDPSILADAVLALRAQAQRKQVDDAAAAIASHRASLDGTAGDFITGAPSSDVTLTEFYDPRCPYCRKMLPDIDALVTRDHKVRLVEKLIPILGPASVLEARAIAAAGRQGRYWQLQHALMLEPGQPDLDGIEAIARKQGIDAARLQRDMDDPALQAELRSNVALAQALGIDGTPSFVLGDTLIPGAVSLDELRRLIAQRRSG